MRRADRLFRLVQLLRGGRVTTAASLAGELEVSLRTVYRDVRDLCASGVPIEGEPGVGYCLRPGFDLPPLMFDRAELQALVLGARMVQAWGDDALARSARSVLSKVEAVLPEALRARIDDVGMFVPLRLPDATRASCATFRRGIESRTRVAFDYVDLQLRETTREVRPLCLVFWGTVWTASAWCELRRDFRTFRVDRMRALRLTSGFPIEPGRDMVAFQERMAGCAQAPERGDLRDTATPRRGALPRVAARRGGGK